MVPRKHARNIHIALAVAFYVVLYFALAWLADIPPAPMQTFVRDEFRIRKNYVLIHLHAEDRTISTNIPDCEYCHIISQPDFMPLREYDALLTEENIHSDGLRHPEKYILHEPSCLGAKIEQCRAHTLNGTAVLDLCSLCENLKMRRKSKQFYIIQ